MNLKDCRDQGRECGPPRSNQIGMEGVPRETEFAFWGVT